MSGKTDSGVILCSAMVELNFAYFKFDAGSTCSAVAHRSIIVHIMPLAKTSMSVSVARPRTSRLLVLVTAVGIDIVVSGQRRFGMLWAYIQTKDLKQ
jgi:hypothetical protein